MKRVVGPAGYTIVETMIFLAVSALLFFSASILISGRQRRTQFVTTVRDFSSKLQSVSGNVASGYYNSTGNVTCSVSGNAINSITSGGNEQGTNSNCVYLGQVVVSPQQGESNFQIVSLVGLRTTGTPAREVTSLTDAAPRIYTDTAETYALAGAEFVSAKADTTVIGSPTGSSVAFIGSFSTYNSTGNFLNTGASHTNVYAIPSSDISRNGVIETALPNTSQAFINPKNINYCLTNGEQNALVTLVGGTASYVIGDRSLCS